MPKGYLRYSCRLPIYKFTLPPLSDMEMQETVWKRNSRVVDVAVGVSMERQSCLIKDRVAW